MCVYFFHVYIHVCMCIHVCVFVVYVWELVCMSVYVHMCTQVCTCLLKQGLKQHSPGSPQIDNPPASAS